MNAIPRRPDPGDTGRQTQQESGDDDAIRPRSQRLRLNPIWAIAIAACSLALSFRLDMTWPGPRVPALPSLEPDEAVDLSLRRLVRSRVIARLEREQRLPGPLAANQAIIDDEIARIREHSLYLKIKEKMANHLRDNGYQKIPIKRTTDPREPMLSIEPETVLYNFIHSQRARCPSPGEKVAAFLREHEATAGRPIVADDGAGGFDMAFTFLIQVLFEFPDELARVAGSVQIYPAAVESDDENHSQQEHGPTWKNDEEADCCFGWRVRGSL